MSGYSLLKEHDDHYEISHPDHGQFKVAKKGLNKRTQDKIGKLPKGYAEGGEVEAPQGLEASEGSVEASPAPVQAVVPSNQITNPNQWDQEHYYQMSRTDRPTEEEFTAQFGPKPGPPKFDADTADKNWLGAFQYQLDLGKSPQEASKVVGPRPLTHLEDSIAYKAYQKKNAPVEEESKEMSPGLATTENAPTAEKTIRQEISSPQEGQAPSQGAQMPSMGNYDEYMRMIQQGITGGAAAGAKGQQQAADIMSQYAQNVKTANDVYVAEKQKIDLETDRITKDIQDSKIDPNRAWHNLSTGNKVMAGLSIILGGIGAGLAGGPNVALQTIDNEINRDIESQKADLGKKESLLSVNLRKYGNLREAHSATNLQLSQVVQANLAKIAANTKSAEIQNNANIALGELGTKIEMQKRQMAFQMVEHGAMAGAVTMSPQEAVMYGMGDKMVPSDDGRVALFAKDKESATKAADVRIAYNQLNDTLNEYRRNIGPNGLWSASADTTKALQIEVQRHVDRILSVQGRSMDEDERKALNSLTADPGSWRPGKAENNLGNIRGIADRYKDAAFSTYLTNYRGNQLRSMEAPPVAGASMSQKPPVARK